MSGTHTSAKGWRHDYPGHVGGDRDPPSAQDLADKPLARHRDHTELLSGEIIRRRHDDSDFATIDGKTDALFREPVRYPYFWIVVGSSVGPANATQPRPAEDA